MTKARVTITKKHKYSMGAPDGGGNRLIFVTGEITMDSFSHTTLTGLEFDLSGDIPNVEGVFIQGDSGYIVQYNYSSKYIEIYANAFGTASRTAFVAGSETTLAYLVFKFTAWGF